MQFKDEAELDSLNPQPTSFVRADETVDRLRVAAGSITQQSPDLQRLLKDSRVRVVYKPVRAPTTVSSRYREHSMGRLILVFSAVAIASPALAQDAQELAKKLSNPVAALISVPLQLNYDKDIGPRRQGDRWTLNMQPVVPIELNKDWNIISRTILPVIAQDDIVPGAGSQFGLGDTVQSLFFSPKAPTAGGWIWGAGPVLLIPTGTDDLLSAKKWGGGPTAVLLKQDKGWTYGALANHIWSFAGDSARRDISSTFLQPFLSYTTKGALTYTINAESTYDWKAEQWTLPFNVLATKVTKVGSQLISVGGGLRYWVDGPESAPHGWGVRVVVTLLFPK